MFDVLTLSALAFFVIVGIIVYIDRKNIDFKYVMLLRRTKRGIVLIDRIAKSAPRFWNAIGLVAIPTAVVFMLAGVVLMLQISSTVLSGTLDGPAMSLILPSLSSEQKVGLGGYAFFLPLWFWLIMVTILLVPHEIFHGILARTVKVPLKSVGLMLLLIFPGAFVEPDENKLKKAKKLDRLKVFSAGAFANVLTAVLLFALLSFVFQPIVVGAVGVRVYNVSDGSSAQMAGMLPNATITEINGVALGKNSRNPIGDAIAGLRPGDNVSITTDSGIYYLKLGANPQNASKPFIGIITTGSVLTKANYMSVDAALAVFNYVSLLIYFAVIIALVNLLPWKPFDGGLVFETLMEYVAPKKAERIAGIATILIAAIFLFNMFGQSLLKLMA